MIVSVNDMDGDQVLADWRQAARILGAQVRWEKHSSTVIAKEKNESFLGTVTGNIR
jgi:hypothetical protein